MVCVTSSPTSSTAARSENLAESPYVPSTDLNAEAKEIKMLLKEFCKRKNYAGAANSIDRLNIEVFVVESEKGPKLNAKFNCMLCPKSKHTLSKQGQGAWCLSNFTRHLNDKHSAVETQPTVSFESSRRSFSQEDSGEGSEESPSKRIRVDDKEGEVHNAESIEKSAPKKKGVLVINSDDEGDNNSGFP